jgi:hypothetical protein
LNGDWIALAIAFGSVLIASFAMRRGTQVGSMTLLALTMFAIGGYLRGVYRGPRPHGQGDGVSGGELVAQMEQSWSVFMNMSAGTLLSYFIAFMLMILIIFGMRTVFGRG